MRRSLLLVAAALAAAPALALRRAGRAVRMSASRRDALGAAFAAALAVPATANAVAGTAGGVERDFFNGNAIFKEDYYYKFGKLPPIPLEDAREALDSLKEAYNLPFVRTQIRYDAYNKYADRIKASFAAYDGPLKKAVDSSNWAQVAELAGEKGDVRRGLRAAGMFSTTVREPYHFPEPGAEPESESELQRR
mmetsp:Transcript_44241/g.138896  ORF Transcript_44241/g.138896 Transcript_44241/m.138896 type:complete len:193 (-) Transcript_44241:310-888(-)